LRESWEIAIPCEDRGGQSERSTWRSTSAIEVDWGDCRHRSGSISEVAPRDVFGRFEVKMHTQKSLMRGRARAFGEPDIEFGEEAVVPARRAVGIPAGLRHANGQADHSKTSGTRLIIQGSSCRSNLVQRLSETGSLNRRGLGRL
jgi:hypothetical protein